MAKSAKWDTTLGLEMYMEGKSDGEIADACRVKTSTITSYRLRHWRIALGDRKPPMHRGTVRRPVSWKQIKRR